MMGKPVRRAAASSSASRAGRGGTSASRYAATRGATRFILSLPRQSAINRQVPQRRRLLPRLLVQPRQVEVRVRQPPIGSDRLLVSLHRVVGTSSVLQRDAKVVPGRRVVGIVGDHRPEMRLRLLGATGFDQQPPQVHPRVGMMRIELERPPVGIARVLRRAHFQLEPEVEPLLGVEIVLHAPGGGRLAARQRGRALGQARHVEVEYQLPRIRIPGEGAVAGYHAVSLSRDRKSTRLNSSHANISYAVFCLKKKNTKKKIRG